MPARPAKVSRVAAHGHPEPGDLGQAPRDDQQPAGVVAGAEAVGHAGGDGDDVLQGAADLEPHTSEVRVDAEALGGEAALELAGDELVVGRRPRRRRRGRRGSPWPRLGPVSTGDGIPGQLLMAQLAHAQLGADLEALRQRHDRHPRADVLADLAQSVSRKPWVGTPITTTSAAADGVLDVARRRGGRGGGRSRPPGTARCGGARSMASARSARRDHSMVGELWAARWATVVPTTPAPTTAT